MFRTIDYLYYICLFLPSTLSLSSLEPFTHLVQADCLFLNQELCS